MDTGIVHIHTQAHGAAGALWWLQCKLLKVSRKVILTRRLSWDVNYSGSGVTSRTWLSTYHRSRKALASWSLLSRGQKGAFLGPLLHTNRRTPVWPDGTSLAAVPRTSRYRDMLDTSHPDIHIHMPYRKTLHLSYSFHYKSTGNCHFGPGINSTQIRECTSFGHVRGSYRKSSATFFLHANWEQQTKESVVVDGTSCCVILECLVTSISCITWLVSLLTKWPTTICPFASVL